jgi:AcrR family transcriptional regulator
MGMSVPYELTGRVSQKARTRDALISATRELLSEGVSPTMEGAAARASISRTTAYRYFPNLRTLLAATYPHIDEESLLGAEPPEDLEARLELVAEDQARRILTYEPEMRAVLRLSLEPDSPDGPQLPMNRRLRIGWIEDALLPLRRQLSGKEFRRLVQGIGSTLGIESFVWLVDIAEVSREEAVAIMCSNALALLRSARAESAASKT